MSKNLTVKMVPCCAQCIIVSCVCASDGTCFSHQQWNGECIHKTCQICDFKSSMRYPSAIGPMTWFHYKLLKIVKFSASFWNCSATGGYWHAMISEFHVSRKKKVYPSLYCICLQHWLLIVQGATKLLWVWRQMKKKEKRLEVHTFCHEGRLQLHSCA